MIKKSIVFFIFILFLVNISFVSANEITNGTNMMLLDDLGMSNEENIGKYNPLLDNSEGFDAISECDSDLSVNDAMSRADDDSKKYSNNILQKTFNDENNVLIQNGLDIELKNSKLDSNLSIESKSMDYSENTVINLNYNDNATGNINITFNGNKYDYYFENIIINKDILLPECILPDEYEVSVSYSGDNNFTDATATTNWTIFKALSNITLTNSSINLFVEDISKVNYTLTPCSDSDMNVTFTSNDSNVVNVNQLGELFALREGSAIIFVNYIENDKYLSSNATLVVNVSKIPTEISFSEIPRIAVGDIEVCIIIYLINYTEDDFPPYHVSISDNDIAYGGYDGEGYLWLYAENVGSTIITVSYEGNYKYCAAVKSFNLTVNKPYGRIIHSIPPIIIASDLIDCGYVEACLEYGESLHDYEFTYVSSNPFVVTVYDNGRIQGWDEGQANVTITYVGSVDYDGPKTVVVPVTVKMMEAGLSLPITHYDVKVGDQFKVKYSCAGYDGCWDLQFHSLNESVVSMYDPYYSDAIANGVGETIIIVSYAPPFHHASRANATVTVTKNDAEIVISKNSVELKVGDNCQINATLSSDAGYTTFNYTSSNESVVKIDDGNLVAMGEGTAIITVSFAGDYKYNPAKNKTFKVTVGLNDAHISAKDIVLNVGDIVIIDVNTTPKNLNIDYVVDNSRVVKVDENGVMTALKSGTTHVTLSVGGDGKYVKNSTVISVSVNKIPTDIDVIDNVNMEVDDCFDVNATLTPAGAGTLKYVSLNNSIVKVENGKLIAVGPGETFVTVSFAGDYKYFAKNKTISVKVVLKDATIQVVPKYVELFVGENEKIYPITVPERLNVIFSSSDESIVTVKNNNGLGIITAVGGGNVIITAYINDNKYVKNSTTILVNVKDAKQNPTMNIDADELIEDENFTITVKLPKDAKGNVAAVVDGKTYTTPVVNGIANIPVHGLKHGKYTVLVSYSGDDKYNPISKEINYTVEEIDKSYIISAPDVTKYYKGPERFVVNITDYAGNPVSNRSVTIVINGQKYDKITKNDGTTSIALGLNSGVYNVTVTVGSETSNSVVTILSTVNGTDVVKVYRNATPYYATFRDSEGNYLKEGTTVTFNINGVMYERKISGGEGLAKLNLNLEQGIYVITATNPKTGEMASNNITIISRLVENNDVTKYYRNATQYTVKVLGDDGNPVGAGETVIFNINGVMYNRQTNESGIAKLNLNLQPDDFIITAEYKNCKVSNKIKILPVLSAEDISMKYRDGTKFVATLVDGQGKAFAGQTIQFNINGVFYNRVTDSAGQAKLNINLQAGKYIITSSYNGANLANTVTISA